MKFFLVFSCILFVCVDVVAETVKWNAFGSRVSYLNLSMSLVDGIDVPQKLNFQEAKGKKLLSVLGAYYFYGKKNEVEPLVKLYSSSDSSASQIKASIAKHPNKFSGFKMLDSVEVVIPPKSRSN